MIKYGVTRIFLTLFTIVLGSLVVQAGTGKPDGKLEITTGYDAGSLSQQWQFGIENFLKTDPSLTPEQAAFVQEALQMGTPTLFDHLLNGDKQSLEIMDRTIQRAFSLFPADQLGNMISFMGQTAHFLAEKGPLSFLPYCNCDGVGDCIFGTCKFISCLPNGNYLEFCR